MSRPSCRHSRSRPTRHSALHPCACRTSQRPPLSSFHARLTLSRSCCCACCACLARRVAVLFLPDILHFAQRCTARGCRCCGFTGWRGCRTRSGRDGRVGTLQHGDLGRAGGRGCLRGRLDGRDVGSRARTGGDGGRGVLVRAACDASGLCMVYHGSQRRRRKIDDGEDE